jgi:hypothetical protein
MLITEDRLQKALTYIAETDEQEAQLHALVIKTKKKEEAIFDTIAAIGEGTVLERKARAHKHPDTESAVAAHLTALSEHRHVKNKRDTEKIIIDVWRSENATRRQGNIT